MNTVETPSATAAAGEDRRYAAIPEAECLDLLGRARLGRICFRTYTLVAVRPVNFVLDGSDLVFRTAVGSKLMTAVSGARVTFEVDDFDPETGTGWSVIAVGIAGLVRDPQQAARVDKVLHSWMPGDL